MWSFHTIAPYDAPFSQCQLHNRDCCSSAVCRHWCPCHSAWVAPCPGAPIKAWLRLHTVNCICWDMGFILQHLLLYQNHAKSACQKLLQLLEQQPQSGLWKSSCVPSASYIIFLIKVLKWAPAAILLLTHVTKHPSLLCHWLGRGAQIKTRSHSRDCEGLEWSTWDRVMSADGTQDLAGSFTEMQILELSMEYTVLSVENVECLTPETFSHV